MNHIKIELDFIPVEERLPEEEQWVFGLLDGYREPHRLFFSLKDEHWNWFSIGHPIRYAVTHWAEIPSISEKEDKLRKIFHTEYLQRPYKGKL